MLSSRNFYESGDSNNSNDDSMDEAITNDHKSPSTSSPIDTAVTSTLTKKSSSSWNQTISSSINHILVGIGENIRLTCRQ